MYATVVMELTDKRPRSYHNSTNEQIMNPGSVLCMVG